MTLQGRPVTVLPIIGDLLPCTKKTLRQTHEKCLNTALLQSLRVTRPLDALIDRHGFQRRVSSRSRLLERLADLLAVV